MVTNLRIKVSTRLFLLIFTLLFSSCLRSDEEPSQSVTTLTFWHINSDESSMEVFEAVASTFEDEHPGFDVDILVLNNDEYKTKLALQLASGTPPDLFHSWGGGDMAEQAEAGFLKDLSPWILSDTWPSRINPTTLALYSWDDKIYGFPHDLGAVGFWYNTEILSELGYPDFPDDWDGFLGLLDEASDSGITPIALGIADHWTVMYYWVYSAIRLAGPDLFVDIYERRRPFTDPAIIQAAEILQDLFRRDPFQPTAMGDSFPIQSGLMGDGGAAMQLMGQWALAIQNQFAERGDELSSRMAFAPFPSLPGGAGGFMDAMGGGNGFVVGFDAPDETVSLLETFLRPEYLQRYFDGFPAVPTDPTVGIASEGLRMVRDYVAKAEGYALYPDQLFPTEIGGLLNDISARVMIGELDAQEAAEHLDTAWGSYPSP